MKTKHHHGKGNRKAQAKRRRERHKTLPPRQEEDYELIDGNFSHYPVAFCKAHNGFLTTGLTESHHCQRRYCIHYESIHEELELI